MEFSQLVVIFSAGVIVVPNKNQENNHYKTNESKVFAKMTLSRKHSIPSMSQPAFSGPIAIEIPSGQQPNSVSLQLRQPSFLGPVADRIPSGQHPNLSNTSDI